MAPESPEPAPLSEIARNLGRYYSHVDPEVYSPFLKETFSRYKQSELEAFAAGQQEFSRDKLDGMFLREAFTFLKASISNILAFKNLMCENFFPWGRVTLYYANFYLANCMLRLNGYAIVHVTHVWPKSQINIQLERNRSSSTYTLRRFGARDHGEVWRRFTRSFPHILSPDIYKVDIEDREMWNYDPYYFSQGTDTLALSEARHFCENNFLDEHFEERAVSFEDAERRFDLMADLGFHEGAAGYGIREAIKLIGTIGKASEFRENYRRQLDSISKAISVFQARPESQETIQSWLAAEIREVAGV